MNKHNLSANRRHREARLVILSLIFIQINVFFVNANAQLFYRELTPEEYYQMGSNYLVIGNYQDAVSAFEEVIRINPMHTDGYVGLGVAYFNLGEERKSIKFLKKAIRLSPNHIDAHSCLVIIYKKMGEYDLADKHREILRKIDPWNNW